MYFVSLNANRKPSFMNSRRNFLLKGSMATTALIAYNPFKSFANTLSPVTGFSINDNKVIFLHTGDHKYNRQVTGTQVGELVQKNAANLMLVHAGDINNAPSASLKYDIALPDGPAEVFSKNSYRILHKGNIKTGIVYAAEGEKGVIKRINELSAWLKNTKGCHVVVCLSQLGYKNKTSVDDVQLANESSHLDVILCSNSTNFSKRPFIAHNSNKEEVIINSAAGNIFDFGNIEMCFDDKGKKSSIAINNLRKRFNPDREG